jgi:nicotinamidase/pyrazinamidase
MLDRPLVFVDVDTQRDFLEPGGALFMHGTEPILDNLARLSAFAREHGIPVLATACAHTLDEPDPEPFPPHCLLGTPGHERIAQTARRDTVVLGAGDHLAGDAVPRHLTLHKRRYDLFTHPDADRIIGLLARGSPTFVIYGVATDYCVKAAAGGLLDRGRCVTLVVDAMRAVDSGAEPRVLTELARRGALLVLTDVVCGP